MDKKITLKDIAGYEYQKEEAIKIIDFFKNYNEYIKNGASLPSGMIFYGEPGNGKTMFANAIANESEVPCFVLNDATYEETTNLLAELRNVFTKAKESAPSILIIDEIDQIVESGRRYMSAPTDKQRETLRLLLTEIDTLNGSGVFVIATCNTRIYDLPPALVRNGRIEKHINMSNPDKEDRENILKLYLDKSEVFKEVDAKELAKITNGFSCSSLSAIVNEVLIYALSEKLERVFLKDFNGPIQSIISNGTKNKPVDNLSPVIYHEIGHLICDYVLNGNAGYISVESYGETGGRYKPEDDDRTNWTTENFVNNAVVAVGGLASAYIFTGKKYLGAESDLCKIKSFYLQMRKSGLVALNKIGITQFGNDYDEHQYISCPSFIREVNRFYAKCYRKASRIIRRHKKTIMILFKELEEKKTLTTEEVLQIIGKTN